jgi:lipoprotein-anchoring transpeptidase ErfK/SrfK
MRFLSSLAALAASVLTLAQLQEPGPTIIDGISFADQPTIYVPIREICGVLEMQVGYDGENALIDGIAPQGQVSLVSGTRIAPLRSLQPMGITLQWNEDTDTAMLRFKDRSVEVTRGPKWVVIDKGSQTLEAYQGQRLVLRTPISSGRIGHETPNGEFAAGPIKDPMHYSRLYDNSPMPWSVQVEGDIFVHGYDSVPDNPASHGCIRMRTDGANPARWFFQWVDIGTPITIQGEWQYRER